MDKQQATTGWIKSGKHEIYLERYGTSHQAIVVLLHHGLGSCSAWKGQIPTLVENGQEVWVYDRWGYGLSSDRPALDPPWFEEDVADLARLLEGITKPVILIGHSDGGNIAMSYALRYPEKVLGLMIVAAHIYLEPKMIKGILDLKRDYEKAESVLRAGLQRRHGEKAVFYRWWSSWGSLLPGWDMRPQIAGIRCPVLVVQGDKDEHATLKHAQDCAEAIPHSRLWIVENAGHMLPQELPHLFNERMLEFIGELMPQEEKGVQ